MSDQGIFILHLSDLHINPKKEGDSKPIFDNLCKKLKEFRDDRGKAFDLLIISGDLVNQGAGDYGAVSRRIAEILAACGLSKDQVFLVPGNHDVERGAFNRTYYDLLIESLKRNPIKFDSLTDDQKNWFWPGFKAFQDFALQYPLVSQNTFDLPGFSLAELEIWGIPFRLCGLNSAILAGPLDGDKPTKKVSDRIIGKNFLTQMLIAGNDRINLVVSHYPIGWVNATEQNEVAERLRHAGAIYFNGHIHKSDSNIQGIQPDTQLFALGVGSLYGQKWEGRNHCQILELNPGLKYPLLHEYFWFGQYGWRRFVPLEINWPNWERWKDHFRNAAIPQPGIRPEDLKADSGEIRASRPEHKPYHDCGLIDIGNNRPESKRIEYYLKALSQAAPNSELIVVGRSLIDFSLLHPNIESAINEKKLHVKLALLDEHALFRNKANQETSWVEQPIPGDWSIRDVPQSMKGFREIRVQPNTGSLEIYGLPFYTSHSFISFTSKEQGRRYGLEELGMALNKDNRPYVEFEMMTPDSYGCTLENLYRGFMHPDRLLIRDDGARQEWNTTQRSRIILSKTEKYGLVDLGVGRESIDWAGGSSGLLEKIMHTPPGGEIFIVGRSLVAFTENQLFRKLGDAIVLNQIKCTFVLADARIEGLTSLVEGDYAYTDLGRVWQTFQQELARYIRSLMQSHALKNDQVGQFSLYGIPAYLPETFAVYTQEDGSKYCSIEVGIGVIPQERTILYFENVSDHDIFTYLNKIYRSILINREPALTLP